MMMKAGPTGEVQLMRYAQATEELAIPAEMEPEEVAMAEENAEDKVTVEAQSKMVAKVLVEPEKVTTMATAEPMGEGQLRAMASRYAKAKEEEEVALSEMEQEDEAMADANAEEEEIA